MNMTPEARDAIDDVTNRCVVGTFLCFLMDMNPEVAYSFRDI